MWGASLADVNELISAAKADFMALLAWELEDRKGDAWLFPFRAKGLKSRVKQLEDELAAVKEFLKVQTQTVPTQPAKIVAVKASKTKKKGGTYNWTLSSTKL